jgi:hypothetical protein
MRTIAGSLHLSPVTAPLYPAHTRHARRQFWTTMMRSNDVPMTTANITGSPRCSLSGTFPPRALLIAPVSGSRSPSSDPNLTTSLRHHPTRPRDDILPPRGTGPALGNMYDNLGTISVLECHGGVASSKVQF